MSLAPEWLKPSVPPKERAGRKGRPIAPAIRRLGITTFEYSYAFTRPSRIACSTVGPNRKKPTSSFEAQPAPTRRAAATPGDLAPSQRAGFFWRVHSRFTEAGP